MTSEKDTDGLAAFFDAANRDAGPGDDLMARVLADAAAVQAEAARAPMPEPARPGLLQTLGGWITVSGLAAACAAGVAIGVSLPSAVSAGFDGSLGAILTGQEAVGFAGFDAVSFVDGGVIE